jgi:hypothetical protein
VNTAKNAVRKEDISTSDDAPDLNGALIHIQIVAMHAPEEGWLELRSFSDKERDGKGFRKWLPTRPTQGQLEAAVEWASVQSGQGRGVFISYNVRISKEGTKANVRRLTAAYVDLDLEKRGISREVAMKRIKDAPAAPELVVESGRGLHVIYFFQPTEDKAAWRGLQARLAEFFALVGADNSLRTDEARVLRMTPFPNQKEDAPRPTSIVGFTPLEEPRSLEDIATLFGPVMESPQAAEREGKKELAQVVAEGGRNDFLFREACALRQRGYEAEEIEGALLGLNEGRCQPPLADEEVRQIAESASRYEAGDILGGAQQGLQEGDLFTSWGVMSHTDYEPPEYLVYGLCRGDVGMVQAVTNVGKSSLLRNLAVSLAFGGEYLTLAEEGEPRRVMLLDYETAQGRYVDDLRRMTAGLTDEEQSLVSENLWSYVGKSRGTPYMNLTNPEYFGRLRAEAKGFRPDLIIVDTLTAGFALQNENDNGEVTNKVMKPLASLAVEVGAAVLFAHHIGKSGSEEGAAANRSYRARGASAFEGMSAAAIQLDVKKNPSSGERVLAMGYTKVKDEQKPDLVLELNHETRWFEVSEGATAVGAMDENYHRLVSLVKGPMETRQIEEAAYFVSTATCKRYLKRAVRTGQLGQPKRGIYQPAGCLSLDEGEEI